MSREAIELDDLLGRERYGVERAAIRRRIIEHKRSRRVGIGDRISLLFEDRATVWYQTQEMLWVEHITDLDAVRDELAVYGALLPGASELSATLMDTYVHPRICGYRREDFVETKQVLMERSRILETRGRDALMEDMPVVGCPSSRALKRSGGTLAQSDSNRQTPPPWRSIAIFSDG